MFRLYLLLVQRFYRVREVQLIIELLHVIRGAAFSVRFIVGFFLTFFQTVHNLLVMGTLSGLAGLLVLFRTFRSRLS